MDTSSALPPAALALGICFDGRTYHYRDYSYDRLADALDYARLDHARPGFRGDPAPHQWKTWRGPSPEERASMAAHGISYQNGYYRYGPYRYDQLAAALDYARRQPGLAHDGGNPEASASAMRSPGGHGPFPPQLAGLLRLARDLFQTDDAGHSLDLVGRALVELLRADTALLLVHSGDQLEIVGFDPRGAAHPDGAGHPLYPVASRLLSGLAAGSAGHPAGTPQCEPAGPRTLAAAAPMQDAVTALAVAWEHDLDADELDRGQPVLSNILELTAAALGKIEARGVLQRLLGEQREHLASTSAAHAAELAQRDEAAHAMRLLSLTDVLTGLYNRRGFFLQGEQMFKIAQRKRAPSAVIFADIDGLKQVNDALGHDAGDSLIRDAAAVFRESFRQADVVARLGGDEFVAFTLDDEQPEVILARIRANLHAFNLMQERPYAVSISAGVVQCDPGSGWALSRYVQLADEQMYDHKRSRLH